MLFGISRTGAIARVGVCSIIGVGVCSAIAHDEDWRKLADAQGPYQGPMMTMANGGAVIAAGGFDSENIEMLAWIPLNEMPGGQGSGNDCWGYVSESGREYAIMGVQKGFVFYEITDPGNPQFIEYVNGPSSTWHDVKVIGTFAYGVSEGGSGIQVMDMTNIDSGIVDHVGNVQNGGHSSTHNIVANPDSGYLYLVGANIGNGGLVSVDVSTPEAPVLAGSWTNMYVHDAQVVTYSGGPYDGREIAFCFVGGAGLRIVDVTDKNNMFQIGSINYPGSEYGHQGWLGADSTYLYLNDELDEINGAVATTTTRVFDVSDLTNPTLVSTFSNGSPSIDHNCYAHEGLLYEANYRNGLRVWDLSNETDPTEVAYFDTYPANDNASFNGAWSTYPFFLSGTVIVSDAERGLFVLDIVLERLTFQFPQALPETLDPGTPTTVSAEVLEDGALLDPSTVTLHVSVDGGAFSEIAMDGPGGPGVFSADLPASECFELVEFYFSADSMAGDTFKMPNGAPISVYAATVMTGQDVIATDEFEAPSGWTVGDVGDQATTGIWERANPQGTEAQPEDDHTDAGTDCFVTGASAGGGLGDNDIDNGATTLFSPIYDMSSQDIASISYWRWYSNDAGNAPNTNVFVVDISNDGGDSWVNVETIGPGGPETSGGWIQHSFFVNDVIELTDSMQLRFIAEDDPTDGEGSIVEAALDDLVIEELICEDSCPVDFNGDGSLDILDFVAFQGAFQNGEDSADFNGDGVLNILDFVAFQGAFQAGC